ncbi:hypothetical protein AAK12_003998 [Salmonella enterica subsp. enterica]|nr:hypothetical protein [Salmonella enterica subsp. enterica]
MSLFRKRRIIRRPRLIRKKRIIPRGRSFRSIMSSRASGELRRAQSGFFRKYGGMVYVPGLCIVALFLWLLGLKDKALCMIVIIVGVIALNRQPE